ncbi:MAG: SBBP repeat-containing protein [Candidatus Manganitrophus sp. SA1]|nr:SBBP repeat-containing protein [Candidatus Manganitrophus morganii]
MKATLVVLPLLALLCLPAHATPPDRQNRARAKAAYGELPLSFESNEGQTDEDVAFLSRGNGYTLFLTPNEVVLSLKNPADSSPPSVLRMQLLGADPQPRISGEGPLPGKSNYFIGQDRKKWRTDIRNYKKVKYQNVYPGIDLVHYGNRRRLEYDFIVSPGADPDVIQLGFQGAEKVEIDRQGDLILHIKGETVRMHRPVIYQEGKAGRETVSGRYFLEEKRRVRFALGRYDRSRPLVIDPILSYSTYLGGSGVDSGRSIAVDAAGNAYVTGWTASADFPISAGAAQNHLGGAGDVFVAKLNAAGNALVYSTYLGGNDRDEGRGIAVDASGNAYITGITAMNFPTTEGAFQTVWQGGHDAFVAKLNPAGDALVYSTYLGGSGDGDKTSGPDEGNAIAVDAEGHAYVTGRSASLGFPVTPDAYRTTKGEGDQRFIASVFMTKLHPAGTGLVYSTFLGGESGRAIALDGSGHAYVTGSAFTFPTTPNSFQKTEGGEQDAFVAKLNPTGSAVIYASNLGGSRLDIGQGIAVDPSGHAYVTGTTHSLDFPTVRPLQGDLAGECADPENFWNCSDAFLVKVNPTGSALVYATYLGGSRSDFAHGVAVDKDEEAYVTGGTISFDFPTVEPIQADYRGGGCKRSACSNAFVSTFDADGRKLIYSTYLGGTGLSDEGGDYGDAGFGIAVDAAGGAYVTGAAAPGGFPTTPGAFQTSGGFDAFIAKISSPPVPPPPQPNGADLVIEMIADPGQVAAGEEFTFTAVLFNHGPEAAAETHLTAALPQAADFLSAEGGSCQFNEVITCPIGTLPPEATATIVLHLAAHEAGTVVGAASLSSATPDPDAANNSASASVLIDPNLPGGEGPKDQGGGAVTGGSGPPEATPLTGKKDGGGGCVVLRGAKGDPTLAIILLGSLALLSLRKRKSRARSASIDAAIQSDTGEKRQRSIRSLRKNRRHHFNTK